MPPAARLTDMHTCPLFNPGLPPPPHVGGPINMAFPTVQIGFLQAARLGDMAICTGPPDAIAMGSVTVMIGGQPAARMGDMTAHGGAITVGCPTVQIGGAGGGPGGLSIRRSWTGNLLIGNSIVVSGSPGFQAQVINRLALMSSTNAGRTTLAAIDASPHTMTIIEFTGNNSFAGPDSFEDATAAGQPVFDGAGNPINSWLGLGSQKTGTGQGTDVTVEFNPNLTLPNNQDPTNPMPNDAILFHEMEHGSHQMNGTYNGAPLPGWTTQEERTTISTGNPSEADYLRERGYPWQRTSHGTTWAPNP